MNNKQGNAAKYSFGLLETPVSCTKVSSDCSTTSTSTSRSKDSSSSSSSSSKKVSSSPCAPAPVRGLWSSAASCSTSRPQLVTTSTSSSSVKRKADQAQTPVRHTGRSTPSLSKTPGTFKTPRTPATRKTPKTPYTSASITSTGVDTACTVIVAIVEGRGLARGEIGMASLDLKCPVMTMSQFSDTQRYVKTLTKLHIHKPLEILLPNTACDNGNGSKLFQIISDEFQHTTISTVQRRYFNETKGLQYIHQLCLPDYKTVEMEVAAKYYCLATAAALLKYVEFIQNIMFAPNSLKIVFKGSEHTMMIDAVTSRNLELLENQRDAKSSHTLYGVLNYTHTPGGARLLRSNILQPSSDLETIKLRQEVVRELTEKEEVFYNLQAVLAKFLDVDHLIWHCVQIPKHDNVRVAETNITTVICLKHVLALVPVLQDVLKDCCNPLLKAYCKTLEDARFELIMSKIKLIIHDDTMYQKGTLPMRTQKCFAVKPKVNGLLDVARRAYTEIVDDITAMIRQLGKQYNLPVRSAFSTVRGFYIQLPCGGKDGISARDLPPVFIKVTKVKHTLNCTTADLIKLNDRVENSLDEIYLMTNIVMKELLMSVRELISVLYKLSEIVSTLDMLLSCAHACTLSSYEFTDTLAIKMGRHPVLDKIGAGSTVPNNTFAAEDCNMVIITGPNMSGKSTYLKQVALLQIMAQMGSFVPAEYASFRLTSHIFSRVGSDDDMETNSSTFTLEMKEMNYITQNATNNSLIIIDELGRGTSAEEGVGICWAVCEYLLKTKAFAFFVTHFKDLTSMEGLYANVENYFFEVHRAFSCEGSCDKITYTHVLSRGHTKEQHYGVRLAEMSTMPRKVVQDARQLAQHLDTLRQEKQAVEPEVRRQRAAYKLGTKLLQLARNSRLEEQSLRTYMSSLLTHYHHQRGTSASPSSHSGQQDKEPRTHLHPPPRHGQHHDRQQALSPQRQGQHHDRQQPPPPPVHNQPLNHLQLQQPLYDQHQGHPQLQQPRQDQPCGHSHLQRQPHYDQNYDQPPHHDLQTQIQEPPAQHHVKNHNHSQQQPRDD